jgi:Tfp pilus assembly protein PilX
MPESWWGNAIFSLIPTIVLGLIFWMVMRMILRGDRTARLKYDQIEAEERAKAGLPPRAEARPIAPGESAGPAQTSTAASPPAEAPPRP